MLDVRYRPESVVQMDMWRNHGRMLRPHQLQRDEENSFHKRGGQNVLLPAARCRGCRRSAAHQGFKQVDITALARAGKAAISTSRGAGSTTWA
ncbi:MAG: hypothetical protein KA914_10705, partial [Ottowia sp.]|nr:hypothetical protein [Ottowia sp.]